MIHVLCFGNLWAGDDGLGIHLYERLRRRPLPPRVRLFEAGLLGLSALRCFEGCRKAIVVDALFEANGTPGTIRRLRPEELSEHAPLTSHDLGVAYLLRVLPLALAGAPLPAIVILAVTISHTHPADNTLSPAVHGALAGLVAMIEGEISHPADGEDGHGWR